jgi:hypothetical protein
VDSLVELGSHFRQQTVPHQVTGCPVNNNEAFASRPEELKETPSNRRDNQYEND